jgi:hypothetical protein
MRVMVDGQWMTYLKIIYHNYNFGQLWRLENKFISLHKTLVSGTMNRCKVSYRSRETITLGIRSQLSESGTRHLPMYKSM